jgi:anti-sigma factor RsiW
MLTCETAKALVIKEVDGLATEAELADVEAHVGRCEACRTRREANLTVARALSRRVDAPVPPGFARRVSERVAPAVSDGWLPAIDWRRWTEWTLPVAAALVLVAALAGGSATTSSSAGQAAVADSQAQEVDAWAWLTGSDTTEAAVALTEDLTNEELLETMLGARVATGEGSGNGR